MAEMIFKLISYLMRPPVTARDGGICKFGINW